MAKKITFRMHAYSDAAGKYNPEATRGGNEDNFYVDDNLCDDLPSQCESDVVKELCDLGLIMAVADGMGGMNAGEVASEIAVETIQEFFSPGKISPDIAKDHESRKKYLERLIVEADARIKADARKNPEHEGMGSTIILAWIVGDKMTLSWCGDSRAYRFNPTFGIELISEDHSYVQELVKQGVLTYDQTFEHPQGNIITRSLGDETKKAQPETKLFDVYNNDILLLCSDGLSGVLRDRRTPDGEGGYFPGENLEDIIRENSGSLVECREALWKAAENAGWYDNVTAILCEIQTGAGAAPIRQNVDKEEFCDKTNELDNRPWWSKSIIRLSPKSISLILFACILAAAICFGCYKGYNVIKGYFTGAQTGQDRVDSLNAENYVADIDVVEEENIKTRETADSPQSKPVEENKKDDRFDELKRELEKRETKENSEESKLADGELTIVGDTRNEATDTKLDTIIVESFLLKRITAKEGDNYYSLKKKNTGSKFHELVVLDDEMKVVPKDSLKADKAYILLLLSKCSSPEELFVLYKTSGNQLHNHKDEIDTLNENIKTVEDFLKAVKKEQPYTIMRVEQK